MRLLYLSEAEVSDLAPIQDAVEAVESAFRSLGHDRASNRPRQRVLAGKTVLHLMPAGWTDRNYVGFKAYTSGSRGVRFWFHLFDSITGDWLALMEADRLGQRRTGAASAVATKYLAQAGANTIGIYGTGWQAESQLEAICTVRRIERIRCYSRDPVHTSRFAERMSNRLGVPIVAVQSGAEAAKDASILVTITSSVEPVLLGEWIAAGAHINAAGSNWAHRRELDDDAVSRAARVCVDSLEDAQIESGDLIGAVRNGRLRWEQIDELGPVVAGLLQRRSNDDEVTLFKSHGIALEDVALGAMVFERALARGIGREVEGIGGANKTQVID